MISPCARALSSKFGAKTSVKEWLPSFSIGRRHFHGNDLTGKVHLVVISQINLYSVCSSQDQFLANLLLTNPTSGTYSFGYIEEAKVSGIVIPGGTIYLKTGEHRGPNRGYGAAHIWAEHSKEMASAGFTSFEEVPHFVASIVQPGSRLYFEVSQMRGDTRVSVVRSANGTAILQHKGTLGNPSYSIVTAYLKARAHGTLIGTVREFKL
jgi:hypothetical protein